MTRKRIVLKFPPKLIDKPIVYKLVRDYDLIFNILRARVTPREEGEMVVELEGKQDNFAAGIKYLQGLGVKMQPLSQDVTRDESRCTHCGACVTVCPTGALYMDKETMRVMFDNAKCIACEACVPACPPRAMKVKF